MEMNICIDIQSAVTQRAGVGRYTRHLVEHLGACAGDDTLRLVYFDFHRRGLDFATPRARANAIRWCPGRLAQSCWKRLDWPPYDWIAGRADLYHFPNFFIPPLTRGRTVVTIHDVAFLRHPEFAERKNLDFLGAHMARTVRRADAILAVSRFSAAEIAELLGADPRRVFPIHLGLDHIAAPSPEAIRDCRRKYGLDRSYILHVGTLEPRKNTGFLISLFERLTDFDGILVLAGLPGWKAEPLLRRLRDSTRAKDIRQLSAVADADLPGLYGGAALFAFPSIYEGFGFPPLEAMRCGAPVIAAAAGSLPEVLGDAAVLVPDFEPDRWLAGLRRLLSDSAWRDSRIDKGRRQAAEYRWSKTAQATYAIYRQVTA